MKTIYHALLRSIYSVAAVSFIMFTLSSCASKMAFQTSSVVPAAEGMVKYKKGKNNNYNIDVSIKRLARPERLSPPKNLYIVWMNTDGNAAKNIGQITTSSSMLSSTLKSSLETVSTFKPTAFFITAENDGNIQYPGGEVVLKTP